jgi:flagellar FliL protein
MKFLSLVFLLIISSATFASGGGGGSSLFIPLNPPIIVNIMDGNRVRHMQVIIEIKVSKPDNAAIVELHKGPIRHELILLLSSQDAATISSAQGKEQLRKDALTAVQKVLKKLADAPKAYSEAEGKTKADPIVDALYFTNFIIQ